jgi:hypothetical protein
MQGGVRSSFPTAGTRIARKSSVRVTWQPGAPANGVVVPDVLGQTLQAAGAAITRACLTRGQVTVAGAAPYEQSRRPPDSSSQVRQQTPAAGERVKLGAPVSLAVTVTASDTAPALPDNESFARAAADALLGKYSAEQLDEAVKQLQKGMSRPDLLRQLAQQTEIFRGEPEQFLRLAFRAAVCREMTEAEFLSMRQRLGQLPTPKTIVEMVLGSEPANAARPRCLGAPAARRAA